MCRSKPSLDPPDRWLIDGRPGTDDAEFVALTRIQADALVALGPRLVAEAGELVQTARLEDLV